MSYLARLKSEKQSLGELSLLPKAPFDGFGSTNVRHFQKNDTVSQLFDENRWLREIQAAIEAAIAEDQGSLSWCHQNRPDLHQRCTGAFRAVDCAFLSRDAGRVETALWEFAAACRETVTAMGLAA